MLNITDLESLKEAQNEKFDRLKLSRVLSGSLKMLSAARVEPANMQTINDLVQTLLTRHTKGHFRKHAKIFTLNVAA